MPMPNLSSMSVDALLKLRDDIGEVLTRRAAQLRDELSKLGGTDRRSGLKGRKVPIKYRDRTGNTWAGRGAQPVWLREKLKAGAKLQDLLFIKRPPPRNVAEPNAKPLTIGFLFRNRRYLRSASLGIGGFTSISGLLALIGVASSSAIRFNRRSRTSAKIEPGTPMKGLHWPTTPRGTIEPQRLFRALANPNSSDIGAGRPYLFGHVASRVSLPKTRPPPPD